MCISLPKFVPQTFAPSVSSRDRCLSFPTESEEMNGDVLLGEKSVTASDALFRDSSVSWDRVGVSDGRRGRKSNLGFTHLSIGMHSVSRKEIAPHEGPELSHERMTGKWSNKSFSPPKGDG